MVLSNRAIKERGGWDKIPGYYVLIPALAMLGGHVNKRISSGLVVLYCKIKQFAIK